jgi:hypothetical protein
VGVEERVEHGGAQGISIISHPLASAGGTRGAPAGAAAAPHGRPFF